MRVVRAIRLSGEQGLTGIGSFFPFLPTIVNLPEFGVLPLLRWGVLEGLK
jgi:hypothetical protein